jgi:hypothetical protein
MSVSALSGSLRSWSQDSRCGKMTRISECNSREHHGDEQDHVAFPKKGLRILEHDLENDVPRVSAPVDHLFEELVEIAQENDLLGVVLAMK